MCLSLNIFVKIDDYHKSINPLAYEYVIEYTNNINNNINDNNSNKKKKRIYKHRIDTLSESEIITTLILYQLSQYKNLKKFYNDYCNEILKIYFPKLPSYSRFIELEKQVYI